MFNAYTPKGGVNVVPSDIADIVIKQIPNRLYVGGSGNVTLISEDGSNLFYEGVEVGETLEIRFTRVMASGTTATNLIALY